MAHGFRNGLTILLLTAAVFGQNWEVALTSGRVYTGLGLEELEDSSLLVTDYTHSLASAQGIPLADVAEIRSVRVTRGLSSIKKRLVGSVVGGAVGYGVGLVFSRAALPWISREESADEGDPDLTRLFALISSALGVLHGNDWGKSHSREVAVYDLSAMTTGEKIEVTREILASTPSLPVTGVSRRGTLSSAKRLAKRASGTLLEQHWEVRLTSGQTYSHVTLGRIEGDALRFDADSYGVFVPLAAVSRMTSSRTMGRMLPGLGALGGLTLGVRFGRLFSAGILDLPSDSPVTLFPAVVGSILGAVAGGEFKTKLQARAPKFDYDLSHMTPEEKTGIIRQIVASGEGRIHGTEKRGL